MIWTSPPQDNVLGPAPATDVLLQLEIKMEEQVKAYLERMQEVRGAWRSRCVLFRAVKNLHEVLRTAARIKNTCGVFARVVSMFGSCSLVHV